MRTDDVFTSPATQKKKNKLKIVFIILVGIIVLSMVINRISIRLLKPFTSYKIKLQDSMIKNDLNRLGSSALEYSMAKKFSSNSSHPVDDFSGLCNDKAFQQSLNMLIKVNGHAPTCSSTKETFTISTLLNSGKYFCVDHEGNTLFDNEINSEPSPEAKICPKQ